MRDLDYYSATQREADEVNVNLFLPDIRQCQSCPLHEERHLACPGWFADSDLDILFVGMSPGDEEDEVGRPFVGRAGKKLMELAVDVGLITSQIVLGFTNIVRCHTPSNRPPTGVEMEACRRWLNIELDMSNPKVVFLMGNTAIQLAFPGTKIGQVAGGSRAMDGRVYIASYHPAAILHRYNPQIEEDIRTAMHLAREVVAWAHLREERK